MLLYISITAFVLAIISLVYNWRTNKNAVFLSLLLIIMSIHGVLHSLIMSKGPDLLLAIIYNNFSPLYFLPGPLLFFYVKGTLQDEINLRKIHLLHLLPFLLILINVIPYWFSSFAFKQEAIKAIIDNDDPMKSFDINWLIPSWLNFILRGGLLLGYVLVSATMVFRPQPLAKRRVGIPREQQMIIHRWLIILVGAMLMVTLGYLIVAILFISPQSFGAQQPNLFLNGFNRISIISFLVIPLTLIFFPQIMYGLPSARKLFKPASEKLEADLSMEKEMKPTSPDAVSLDVTIEEEDPHEPFLALSRAIAEYLEENQPYLEKDFSIDNLARAMDVPRHHLYYCMNKVMKVKFPEMRRKLRIDYAKKLLEEGKNETLSMEGIGNLSGFSSRSNFFGAFKEEVGCTPTEYLLRDKNL